MKRIILYALILVILLLSVITCSPTTTLITTQTYTVTETVSEISWLDIPTYNEFWGTIRVDVGEEFAIALYRQPRLGLEWFASYDENKLVLLTSDFKEYSTSYGWVSGDQYFIFQALKQGNTQISFQYSHTYPEAEILEEKVFNIAISSSNPPSITLGCEPEVILKNKQEVPSEVLLRSFQIDEGISNELYFSPWYPSHIVNMGEPILIVSGTIQNKHKENTWIDMWAEGYDKTREQVSWTLDAAHLAGHILLNLENEETGEFEIHLNYSDDISSINIYANNYAVRPP